MASNDDLTISGGGSTAVATDGLLTDARALDALSLSLDGAGVRLSGVSGSPVLGSARDPEPYCAVAASLLRDAEELACRLRDGLLASAEAYGWADRTAESAIETIGASLGYALGAGLRVAAPAIGWTLLANLPLVLAGAGVALGVSSLIAGSPQRALSVFGAAVSRASPALRDPRFVSMLRVAISSTDNFMLGASGVPYPMSRWLDDRETGLFGLNGAASTTIGLAAPFALRETPVAVHQVGSSQARPPSGFEDLASRIPRPGAGEPQIRVERYDVGEERPHWVVYFSGTIDPALFATDEPWDDTSNLHGIAGGDPASVRAAMEALREAGVQQGDQILPVGYSQGGIVATSVAESGVYDTQELVTFGSPTGQFPSLSEITNVAVEHTDDLIPALGGIPLAAANGGLDRLVVQQSSGAAASDLRPLAAHDIRSYAATGAQMDRSTDPRIVAARQQLEQFTGGHKADVTTYRADRVQSVESRVGSAESSQSTTNERARGGAGGRF
jgi:hypothetical protein